jgi:excisionase family DNA binding protein
MSEKQRFLTISEAAEFLHVSEISLRRWTNSGKLRCFRVGGRNERRFLIEDLLAFMPQTRTENEAEQGVQSSSVSSNEQEEWIAHEHHICLFFNNPDEQWEMMRPYLLAHLSANEPVLYIQDGTPVERLMELLRAEGLPLEELIARGLLRVLPPTQAYLLSGSFDAHRMVAFMELAIRGALEAGYKRMFITGEMTWSLAGVPGSEQMMSYEGWLNPLIEKYPGVTIVCQYDLKRFKGPSILDALLTHPSVHIPRGRAAGFYGLQEALQS